VGDYATLIIIRLNVSGSTITQFDDFQSLLK